MPLETRSTARIGWLAILAGAGIALAVQVVAPVGVPLYDGVVVQEPYRYLHPSGGQVGNPTSWSSTSPIEGDILQDIVAATSESPPQAQLIAQNGAFEISPGATSLQVSITPIEAPPNPPDGTIVGNVYQFTVTDQSGNALRPRSCESCRSLVLRAPEGASTGVIRRFAQGTWTDVETIHAGVVAMYQANVAGAGTYAVIVTGGAAPGQIDSTLILVGGAIFILFLVFVGLVVVRQRPSPAYPAGRGRDGVPARPAVPSRIPSKRKGGRRPPTRRPGP